MNILKKELRHGLKAFIIWSIGLFLLEFAGMTKYSGFNASAGSIDITALLAKFPRIVLAVLGMGNVDLATLGGYYSVLAFYALICGCVYAVHLGSNAVNREFTDKTYEFLLTKPVGRSSVLAIKILSGSIYLFLFCVLHFVFSLTATASAGIENNIVFEMLLFSLRVFIASFLFFSLSILTSAFAKRPEKGTLAGNMIFLIAFIMGVIYDMMENGELIRVFSPLKYFLPSEILDGQLNPFYAAVCVVLSAIIIQGAFRIFNKRDMI